MDIWYCREDGNFIANVIEIWKFDKNLKENVIENLWLQFKAINYTIDKSSSLLSKSRTSTGTILISVPLK